MHLASRRSLRKKSSDICDVRYFINICYVILREIVSMPKTRWILLAHPCIHPSIYSFVLSDLICNHLVIISFNTTVVYYALSFKGSSWYNCSLIFCVSGNRQIPFVVTNNAPSKCYLTRDGPVCVCASVYVGYVN